MAHRPAPCSSSKRRSPKKGRKIDPCSTTLTTSVILETAEAAIRKIAEFRDQGFRFVSVLDAVGTTIEEGALTAMVQTDRNKKI
jgi:hypothetical protein